MKNFVTQVGKKKILNTAFFSLMLIAFLVAITGCGKSDSKSRNYYPGYNGYNPNFPGYQNMGPGINAVGVDGSGVMELTLQISGAAGGYYGSGQVMAQGHLVLAHQVQCGGGVLQAGTYTIGSQQPGMMNNGVFQLNLQGAGYGLTVYGTVIESYPKLSSSVGGYGFDELNASVSFCGSSHYFN